MGHLLADLPVYLELSIVTIVGLILGSFSTALTYRVPREIPWAFNTAKQQQSAYYSACPRCKTRLTVSDLVPVLSWLLSAGKCRHCKAPISFIYPLVEIGVLAMCLISYAVFDFTLPLLIMVLASPFLMALMAIDIERMLLPNQLVLILFFIGLFFHILQLTQGNLTLEQFGIEYALGAVVFALFAWGLGAIMTKILKKEALGFGDVKFFAVAGLWLGLSNLPVFCMLSGIAGIFVAVVWKITAKNPVFPFGPALILTFYILFHVDGSHILDFILK